MKRRSCLKILLASTGMVATRAANGPVAAAADGQHPIELHLDLAVDPVKEAEMLRVVELELRKRG